MVKQFAFGKAKSRISRMVVLADIFKNVQLAGTSKRQREDGDEEMTEV